MDPQEQNPSRNIVLCSDGTGNTAFKDRGTNVFKLFEALELDDHLRTPGLPRQIAYYDDGVGTGSTLFERVLGGAFGYGLKRNVLALYSRLCETWRPEDRIFLFGFSRGAFTVRTLAHLVCAHGIVDKTGCGSPPTESAFQTLLEELWATRFSPPATPRGRRAEIEFVGVWDTVDAVGIPFEEIADLANMYYRFKFPDHELCPGVRIARQALSIDDPRRTFHPKVWTEPRESDRIRQVWFAGVHSNVGGGYPKQGMSLVALDWMMSEAEQAGLRFVATDRAAVVERRNVNDKLYDPRAGLASFYRFEPRDVAKICSKAGIASPRFHESLLDRLELRPESYAPCNLPPSLRIETTARRRDDGSWHRPEPSFRAPTTIPDVSGTLARSVPRIQSGQNALVLGLLLAAGTAAGWLAQRTTGWTPTGSSLLYASALFTLLVAFLFPLSASVNAPRQSLARRLWNSGPFGFAGLLALGNLLTVSAACALNTLDGRSSLLVQRHVFVAGALLAALAGWAALESAQSLRGTRGPSARLELAKLPMVLLAGLTIPGLLPRAFSVSMERGFLALAILQILGFGMGVVLLRRALRRSPVVDERSKAIRMRSENRIWPFLVRSLPMFLLVAYAPSAGGWIFAPDNPWKVALSAALLTALAVSLVRWVLGWREHARLEETVADRWLAARLRQERDLTSG